ncbi:MAG TPA: hypothetical protein DDY91_00115 [Planctomycetaceae bacterium]|jgi:serine/threonine protein kinase|nr:hypothetical protein [Planctomycetaceae bacterium]
MATSLKTIVRQIRESGVLADERLKEFLPPRCEVPSADELAQRLIETGTLTRYQMRAIAQGRGRALNLGNYLLLERIGVGGMGQVFKARHRRLDRLVAIKLLSPHLLTKPSAISRFEREVRAVARINHPNLVTAFDADTSGGHQYLVMELVEGSNLTSFVKQEGPLSVADAVSCVRQAAEGLAVAHEAGIVHRDVKPGNLLRTPEGVIKLLDLGLARLDDEDDVEQKASLTNTGVIMGTVDYMAPEQALDSKTADARADIYSLGCVLWFLITGQPIYSGDTMMKKLLAHREQPIPNLTAARPDVPPALQSVFERMVAKRADERFTSMPAVIAALQSVEIAGPVKQAPRSVAQSPHRQVPAPASPPPFHVDSFSTLPGLHSGSASSIVRRRPRSQSRVIRWVTPVVVGLALLALVAFAWRPVPRTGTVRVSLEPADASLQVLSLANDRELQAPLAKSGGLQLTLAAGRHRLRVVRDGFEPFETEIQVNPGSRQAVTVSLDLKSTPTVAGKMRRRHASHP